MKKNMTIAEALEAEETIHADLEARQERARHAATEFLNMTDDERLWAYNIWRSNQHPDLIVETPHYTDAAQLDACWRDRNRK